MRRNPIATWFTLLFVLCLGGCALPGSGDGGGGFTDDDEDTDGSGSSGQVTIGGPGSATPPPPPPPPPIAGAGGSSVVGTAGSAAPPGSPPPRVSAWPGFTLVPGLGASCPIAAADDPVAQYGNLETKPCTDGTAGCAELVWKGLSPQAAEIGVDPHWDLDLVVDDAGAASHLIVTRRYGITTEGSEIVIFDLADGSAVAGFRNGEPSPIGPFLPALQSACSIAMVGARGRAWMVVSEAGATRVASAAVAELGAELELVQIDVAATVIDGTMLGGPELLALEAEDGELYLVSTAHEVVSTYGPDVRVWLSALAGEHVLVRGQGMDGLFDDYFLMDAAGGFTPLLTEVDAAGTDGSSLAWIERDTDHSVLHVAAADGEGGFDLAGASALPIVRAAADGSGDEPAPLSFASEVRMEAGRVLLRAAIGTSLDDSAFILDPEGRVLAEVPLGSTLDASPLLGLQGPYLWLGAGYDDGGFFPTLQRIEY